MQLVTVNNYFEVIFCDVCYL